MSIMISMLHLGRCGFRQALAFVLLLLRHVYRDESHSGWATDLKRRKADAD